MTNECRDLNEFEKKASILQKMLEKLESLERETPLLLWGAQQTSTSTQWLTITKSAFRLSVVKKGENNGKGQSEQRNQTLN